LGRPIAKKLVGVTKSRASLLNCVDARQMPFGIGTLGATVLKVFFVVPAQWNIFFFHV
jgi:hypothetical protein